MDMNLYLNYSLKGINTAANPLVERGTLLFHLKR